MISKITLSIFSIILLGSLSAVSTVYADSLIINDQASCEDIPGAVWSTSPDTCTITTPQTIASGETWTVAPNIELVITSEVTMETGSTLNGGTITIGTINADVIDINGAIDFDAINDDAINDDAITIDAIHIGGTINADTIDINAGIVTISGTLNASDIIILIGIDGISNFGIISADAIYLIAIGSNIDTAEPVDSLEPIGNEGNISIGDINLIPNLDITPINVVTPITIDPIILTPINVGTIILVGSGTLNINTSSDGQGSGCSGDCTPPTIGVDRTGDRKVSDGFSYNYNTVDVDYFHTEFPLITTQVGEQNTVTAKVYENTGPQNLSLLQFGLGIPEIGSPLNDAEVIIEVWLESGGINVEEIVITDPLNLIDNDSVSASTSLTHCITGGSENDCVEMILYYTYREAPIYNVMLVQPMDKSRHTESTYLNDGIEVQGESLNLPQTMNILPIITQDYPQKRGLTELIQTDRKESLWIDKYGYFWQGNESKMTLVSTIESKQRQDPETMAGYDRNHSGFAKYKEEQNLKAQKVLDEILENEKIHNDITEYDPFTIDFTMTERRDNPVLQQAIIDEMLQAQQILEEMNRNSHRIHLVVD